MKGKKLLVYPWRVAKQDLVEPALLIYGRDDAVAGQVSASNALDDFKLGSHLGLSTQKFDTDHKIHENGKEVIR